MGEALLGAQGQGLPLPGNVRQVYCSAPGWAFPPGPVGGETEKTKRSAHEGDGR